ncbi:MAG: xanthine dehydrogenase family protein subunit M [Chloroflexi bacterium]|nr:xanthine dehydrogenase family protein subunit M [Chloroflexota bacterium]
MKPAAFGYFAPRDLPEALSLVSTYSSDGKVIAGGQSLVPLMNFRLARPSHLIDINGIGSLSGIDAADGRVTIGATTRQRDAGTHPDVKVQLPLLAEAISYIGHLAIQNRGTVGGSIAHADPAAELPVVALALDAQMHVQRTDGQRTIPAAEFSLGYLTTVLEADELLTATSFGVPPAGSGWCFSEVARRHGDFALVAVAVLLTLDAAGKVGSASIALGGVGPVPMRAGAAERLLVGEAPTDPVLRAAADTVGADVEPEDDIHASADYRRHLAGVLVRRALTTARARAAVAGNEHV